MARTSESIWKASRTIQDNQELPDLPEDLRVNNNMPTYCLGKGAAYVRLTIFLLAFTN